MKRYLFSIISRCSFLLALLMFLYWVGLFFIIDKNSTILDQVFEFALCIMWMIQAAYILIKGYRLSRYHRFSYRLIFMLAVITPLLLNLPILVLYSNNLHNLGVIEFLIYQQICLFIAFFYTWLEIATDYFRRKRSTQRVKREKAWHRNKLFCKDPAKETSQSKSSD